MISFYDFKNWLSWRLIRPHLCTLAVAVSFSSTWRAPREAYRFGGLANMLLFTLASFLIALPTVLLQLAVGQLSQQDAVGAWKAVPFFKGIGYIRLLISFIGSLYTITYIGTCIAYMLFILSNSVPFRDCSQVMNVSESDGTVVINSTLCFNGTFLAPVTEQPEYYIALALIVIVLWILFPFILYNPVKLMKRIFYVFGLLVFFLGIVIVSAIGRAADMASFSQRSDWVHLKSSAVWQAALGQALLSHQISGGYLISSGDSIYATSDVQWTTIIFVVANILASLMGVMFWFAVGAEGQKETHNLAVLVQIYKMAAERNMDKVLPLLTFAMLLLSGTVTMLTLLYPLYDRFRRVGGIKWRYLSIGSSVVGVAGALALLAVGLPGFALLEDTIVPFLAVIATVLEISALVFIYGWASLVEDVEFLTRRKLSKYWVWGWCGAPGIIMPFTTWWALALFLKNNDWNQAPWEPIGTITAASVLLTMFTAFAITAVARQVQYDILGKLKSSFRPSRHWGPRDPITHYYWLARREDVYGDDSRTRYRGRQLHQSPSISSFVNLPSEAGVSEQHCTVHNKRRSNSDDWLIIHRKKFLTKLCEIDCDNRKRSKSLDWAIPRAKLNTKQNVLNENQKISNNVISAESIM